MITGFYKHASEQSVTAYITKLVDRVQAYKGKCNIDLLRYFIVTVDSSSESPLSQIELLLPYNIQAVNLSDQNNLTSQLLDNLFPFTKNATSFHIKDINNRIVEWDGIDNVTVLSHMTFGNLANVEDKHTVLPIVFNEEIHPGKSGAICFHYSVNNFFNRMDNGDKEAVMDYFYIKKPVSTTLSMITARVNTIPCLAVHEYFSNDDNRVKGGTDIVLRYPLELEAISNPPPTEITTSSTWNIYGQKDNLERAEQWRYRFLDPSIKKDNREVKPKQISIRITKPLTRKDQWKFFWYGVAATIVISLVVSILIQHLYK